MMIDPDKIAPPKAPYRGFQPFRLLDWKIFFERNIEAERLCNLVSMYSGVLVYGQSGAGKSSLVNAGFLPAALRRGRAPERVRVFPESGRELVVERIRLREENDEIPHEDEMPAFLPSRFTPTDTDERITLSCEEFLKLLRAPSKLGVPLLIFDQFEELVTLFEENPKDPGRFESAQAARKAIEALLCELLLNDPPRAKIVFVFRDDYFARLTPFFARIPNLMDQRVLVMSPRLEVVRQIVRGPFVRSPDGERGLPEHFADELSDSLADKIGQGISGRTLLPTVNLSELQTVCLALWRGPKLREQLSTTDDPAAVVQKILESEALSAVKRLPPWDHLRAVALLSNVVTKDGTRDVVSEENLLNETGRNPLVWMFRRDLKSLLRRLPEETGLLRCSLSAGTTYYELTSEALIPWIQQHQQRFRDLAQTVWGYAFIGIVAVLLLTAYGAYQAGRKQRDAERELALLEKTKTSLEEANTSEAQRRASAERNLAAAAQEYLTLQTQWDLAHQKSADASAAQQRAEAALRRSALSNNQASIALQKELEANRKTQEAKKRAEQNEQLAKEAQTRAVNAKKAADDLVEYINFDLRDSLDTSEPLWEHINQRILEYHEKYPPAADDPEGCRRKAAALGDRGIILLDKRQTDAAAKYFARALEVTDRALTNGGANKRLQSNRATYAANLSTALLANGEIVGARESAAKSVATAKQLVAQQPSNPKWQDDLAFSYSRLAAVKLAEGHPSDALKDYHESLEIQRRFAYDGPGQADWRLRSHRDSVALAEKLAKLDARDDNLQSELAFSYWRMAAVLFAKDTKSKDEGRAMLRKGRSILRALQKRVGLATEQQIWLSSIEEMLRE